MVGKKSKKEIISNAYYKLYLDLRFTWEDLQRDIESYTNVVNNYYENRKIIYNHRDIIIDDIYDGCDIDRLHFFENGLKEFKIEKKELLKLVAQIKEKYNKVKIKENDRVVIDEKDIMNIDDLIKEFTI
jgi:hypothetical protein